MKFNSYGFAVLTSTSLFFGILGTVSRADAFTLTSTDSFSDQLTELTGTPTLNLQRFDQALGRALQPDERLTGITVTISETLRSAGTVSNVAANPQSFRVSTIVGQYDIAPSVGAPSSLATFAPLQDRTIAAQTFTLLAQNTPATFNSGSITNSAIQTITDPTFLNQFLGTGTFSLFPTTLIGTTIIGGGGNINASIQTRADATATIVYTISAVPFEFSPFLGISILGGFWSFNQIKKNKIKVS